MGDKLECGRIAFTVDPMYTPGPVPERVLLKSVSELTKLVGALDKKIAQLMLEIEIIKNIIARNGCDLLVR